MEGQQDPAGEFLSWMHALAGTDPRAMAAGSANTGGGSISLTAEFQSSRITLEPDDPALVHLLHVIAVSRGGTAVLLTRHFQGPRAEVEEDARAWEREERERA